MPDLGGKKITREEFRSHVRVYLRDSEAVNALIEGAETSGAMIDLGIDLTIDNFNKTPPPVGTFDYDGFPSFELLLNGTLTHVLKSAGFLQSRNELNFVDGGIQINSSDKTAHYMNWIKLIREEYETQKRHIKKNLNLEACYGSAGSEYEIVGLYGGTAGGVAGSFAYGASFGFS